MKRWALCLVALLATLLAARGSTVRAAVDLGNFNGQWDIRTGEVVLLEWETGSETTHAYFNVWRSTQNLPSTQVNAGTATKINTQVIVSTAPCSSTGYQYPVFEDRNIQPSQGTYYYYLESVDVCGGGSGSTFYGSLTTSGGLAVTRPGSAPPSNTPTTTPTPPAATATWTPTTSVPPSNTPPPTATNTPTNTPQPNSPPPPSETPTDTPQPAQPTASNTAPPASTAVPSFTATVGTSNPSPTVTRGTTTLPPTVTRTPTRQVAPPVPATTTRPLGQQPPSPTTGVAAPANPTNPARPTNTAVVFGGSEATATTVAVEPFPTEPDSGAGGGFADPIATETIGDVGAGFADPLATATFEIAVAPVAEPALTDPPIVSVEQAAPPQQDGEQTMGALPLASTPTVISVLAQPPTSPDGALVAAEVQSDPFDRIIQVLIGLVLLGIASLIGFMGWTLVRPQP